MVTSFANLQEKLFALAMDRGCFPNTEPLWRVSWKKEKIRTMCEPQKIVMVKFGHHWDTAAEIPRDIDGESNLRYFSEADGSIHWKDSCDVRPLLSKKELDRVLLKAREENLMRWIQVKIDGAIYPARNVMYGKEDAELFLMYDDDKVFEFEVMKGREFEIAYVKKRDTVEDSLREIGHDDFVPYFDFIKEAEDITADGPWYPAYIIQELSNDYLLVHWPYENRTDVRKKLDTEKYWLDFARAGFIHSSSFNLPSERFPSDEEIESHPIDEVQYVHPIHNSLDDNCLKSRVGVSSSRHKRLKIQSKKREITNSRNESAPKPSHSTEVISQPEDEKAFSKEELHRSLHAAFEETNGIWVRVHQNKKWWPARLIKDGQDTAIVQWNGRGVPETIPKSQLHPLYTLSDHFAPYEVEFLAYGGRRNAERVYVLREFENDFLQLYWEETKKSEVHLKEKTRILSDVSDQLIDDLSEPGGQFSSDTDKWSQTSDNQATPKQQPLNERVNLSPPLEDEANEAVFDSENSTLISVPTKALSSVSSTDFPTSDTEDDAPMGYPLTDEILREKRLEKWIKYCVNGKYHVGKIVDTKDYPVVVVQWAGSQESIEERFVPRLKVLSGKDFTPYDVEVKSICEWIHGIVIQEYELDFLLVYLPSSGETKVVPRKKLKNIATQDTGHDPAVDATLAENHHSQESNSIDGKHRLSTPLIRGTSPMHWMSRQSLK